MHAWMGARIHSLVWVVTSRVGWLDDEAIHQAWASSWSELQLCVCMFMCKVSFDELCTVVLCCCSQERCDIPLVSEHGGMCCARGQWAWVVAGIPGQYFDLNQLVRQSANTPTILEGVTYDSR